MNSICNLHAALVIVRALLENLAGLQKTEDHITTGFELILEYANSLHTSTIAETSRWGERLMSELAKFQKTIEANLPDNTKI